MPKASRALIRKEAFAPWRARLLRQQLSAKIEQNKRQAKQRLSHSQWKRRKLAESVAKQTDLINRLIEKAALKKRIFHILPEPRKKQVFLKGNYQEFTSGDAELALQRIREEEVRQRREHREMQEIHEKMMQALKKDKVLLGKVIELR